MSYQEITVCLTYGSRPDLLEITLRGLLPMLSELPVLAVNDFGDAESNRLLLKLCPHATLTTSPGKVGHHPAVDAMYREVRTKFIFHCEDDWEFTDARFLPECKAVLESDPRISQVCVRDPYMIGGFEGMVSAERDRWRTGVMRLDRIHREWFGFTFNPHLIERRLWQSLGSYSRFRKERHISRTLRSRGMFTAYLDSGRCRHIGGDRSCSSRNNPPAGGLVNWLRSFRRPAGRPS